MAKKPTSIRQGVSARGIGMEAWTVLIVAVLAMLAFPIRVGASYTATDTSNPCAGASGMNDAGQILSAFPGSGCLFDNGVWTPIPFPQSNQEVRDGPNNCGQVAGTETYEPAPGVFTTVAARWSKLGGVQHLGPMGADEFSEASVINEAGWAAGSYSVSTGPQLSEGHAFVWVPADSCWSWPPPPNVSPGLHDLGTVEGGDVSRARYMNDKGQILGWGNTYADPYRLVPVVWEFAPDGTLVTTVMELGGWTFNPLHAGINNLGEVVALAGDGTRLVAWQRGAYQSPPQDLGVPPVEFVFGSPEEPAFYALRLNDMGQVLLSHDFPPVSFDAAFFDPPSAWTRITDYGVRPPGLGTS